MIFICSNLQRKCQILICFLSEDFAANGSLSSEGLLLLNSIFGPNLRLALELIDSNSVSKVIAETSDRALFKVKGSIGVIYNILPSSWRCSCAAWMQKTWMIAEHFTCKHILAVKICQAIEKSGKDFSSFFKVSTVSEDTFVQILFHMD